MRKAILLVPLLRWLGKQMLEGWAAETGKAKLVQFLGTSGNQNKVKGIKLKA